jgi:ABC-type lipoprotein export system ATPase subunit
MTHWLVETKDLTKIYGDGAEIRALDGVSIRVHAGELVTVMGPSGSGKSTLLNMIGALDAPTLGQVFVAGEDLAQLENVDEFRAETVGFIFQLHNLLPTLTAQENVEVPMMGQRSRSERQQRSRRLLEMVGLGDRLDHLPNQLSGGQRQRVAVARALANEPPLVLADEPTGSLDSEAGHELMQLLKDLNREQGTTFLVVTHDPAVARQTDRVLVMEDGKIVRVDEIGSPLDEDLRMWRHSELGEKLMQGNLELADQLKLSSSQVDAIREMLKLANHDPATRVEAQT